MSCISLFQLAVSKTKNNEPGIDYSENLPSGWTLQVDVVKELEKLVEKLKKKRGNAGNYDYSDIS